MNNLGTILLAAGSSSRLGQSKQLIDIDGEPLVRRQAQLLLDLQPACVVVVTGAEQQAVVLALQGLPVQCVHNSCWTEGMGSSLACGIAAMPERVRGALLLLCDQWKITADDLSALLERWQQAPLSAVTAQWPRCKPGAGELDAAETPQVSSPPVIFPRALFGKLVRLKGDRGAQQLVNRFKGDVQRVSLPHAAFDIDEATDLP